MASQILPLAISLLHLVESFFAIGITLLCWTYLHPRLARNPPYPPGPPPKSLLFGNASDIPATKPWLTYTEWGKTYGDIIHFRIFGQHTIVLNSIEVVKDLIERRTRIYSDRPYAPMTNLMEWDFNTGLKRYGPQWRIHRRLLNQMFGPAASIQYRPIQSRKMNDFLYSLLTCPDDFMGHYKCLAGAIIMSTLYGYDQVQKGDYFVTLAEAAVKRLSDAFFPGANAVNALPILRYVPTWFPGAGFKRYANETKKLTRQMRNVPFEYVRKGMMMGTASPCIVTKLLAQTENLSEERFQNIKDVTATCYAAGADTSASALGTFFYAMALYPDVQKKAHQELDAVVGFDRVVTYDDRDSLPYVQAIYLEIMRWRPIAPLGVSHCTLKEDIYNGFYIPKGTIVLTNIWAMSHDPKKYKDPDVFDPDRHFDKDGKLLKEDDVYAFGFGRRICPGRHMASSTIWLMIAAVLSTFKIGKKKDASGNDIPIDGQYRGALITHPPPFECSITPRSRRAERLILKGVGRTAC